jgi:hypothetical protein
MESQWGSETLTDPTRNPNGVPNTGAWLFSGHQAVWVWGAVPDPSEVAKYGDTALTNPNNYPTNGASIPGNPGSPPPPDVAPPVVTDTSNGVAPSLTGNVPQGGNGSNGSTGTDNTGQGASQNINGQPGALPLEAPPSHPAYAVSPGAIRNAETGLLGHIDTQISSYNSLKNSVYQAVTRNLATDPGVLENLHNSMDNLLQNHADVIAAMGGFSKQLDMAGQNYAHADMSSFLPQS